MNAEEFNTYWNTHFPDCPLAGQLWCESNRERWFRVHTLPESKRYPETEAEYSEILLRHNAILSDLIPEGETIFVLTMGYSITKPPVLPEQHQLHSNRSSIWITTIPLHEPDEDEEFFRYCHVWLRQYVWHPKSLDPLLRDIADDLCAGVIIIDPIQSLLYLPYDGGADIILPSVAERNRLHAKYYKWLSPLLSGL